MGIESKQLQQLYIAYFARPADPSGINYWLDCSKKESDLRSIAKSLAAQSEYQQSIIFKKSIEFQINYFYVNLFGRKADYEGIKFWISLIEKGENIISELPYDLIKSVTQIETHNSEQSVRDFQTLENKVNAAELFTQELSSSIGLRNLYQPESYDPWITGKVLNLGVAFLSQFNYLNKASLNDVNATFKSITSESIPIINKTIINLKNVSLKIPIYFPENRKFTKIFTGNIIKSVIGGKLNNKNKQTNIEALKNINITIMSGERVALIGHNGSGKSSFLRLISDIYKPTSGKITKNVEVYPMLQKTFLTSTELNGIDASKAYYLMINNNLEGFEEFLENIVDFSGLGSFINLPIKTYSEGMSARLIFSMLTSYPQECLAIDEGFGTGDADFFERAQLRMQSFMDSSTTLILASHSEMLLKQFCHRGIVFHKGTIVFDGPLNSALNYYHTNDYYQNNVSK